jgi:NADH-quinone oxidoreductase subunit E
MNMLSAESLTQIDKEIAKYPAEQRQSAVMSALRIAQVEKGWLSNELMDFVAHYLGMQPIAVYEVATFYNMYNTRPVGRHKICVCTNLPCKLMGADDIADRLKKKLGVEFGETTEDKQFTLVEGECMGACGDAPLLLVNNHRMESFLNEEKVNALLDELKNK